MFFKCNLVYREIKRGEDTDYFIGTENRVVELEIKESGISRMQFPLSRALLIRTSPYSKQTTIHVLRDTDLYSSIVNFVVDLDEYTLQIEQNESVIEIAIDRIEKSTLQS